MIFFNFENNLKKKKKQYIIISIMIEILNQKFPEEISMNILKFMRHETADIIKKELETFCFKLIEDEIKQGKFSRDERYDDFPYLFPSRFFFNDNHIKRCDRCHKFKIDFERYQYFSHDEYDIGDSVIRKCKRCLFFVDLKLKFKSWERHNKQLQKSGEKLTHIKYIKYY
jgi:hypothetical protein